ncbi:6340_t:CDS:10 [Cetraspora pellucida]|uniref:6340_t:CDS:1 n=1 Tax=Cetraspora pellucida TaxID=1433469 RepID=A0A9N9CTS1_9GLOM|nr:6340_t:CDS:10 [Cetraspora pellucida]
MSSRQNSANELPKLALDLAVRAANEEKIGNKEKALELYTKAAEIFVKAIKETKNESLKQNLITRVNALFDRAEKLKASSYKLTQKEIDILKRTSYINGKSYLPWLEADLKEEFKDEEPFLDPDGTLSLSDQQMANFGAWKRPFQIMSNPKMFVTTISSSAIKQDIVTDCSFVASLCVCAKYERKFNKKLITRCIFPQGDDGPVYNPSGKYMIKLISNGIARKVSVIKFIDDLLPVSRDETLMCTFSTNKDELWPSIIEKAMLFLLLYSHEYASYSEDFNKKNTWKRLLNGHEHGDALVTITTGHMTDDEAEDVGLVPTHTYAVLDARKINGLQLLQVKNPWSVKRWTGPYSHLDAINWTPELMSLLEYDRLQAIHNDDGIFWIDFDSVCKNFYLIHMSWNPELFKYHYTLHSSWPLDSSVLKDKLNLGNNPQFCLEIKNDTKEDSATRILLSKHIMKTGKNRDFITLHLYNDSDGKKVYYPDAPWKKLRFNAPPGISRYTIVVDKSQEVDKNQEMKSLEFTLKCYCESQLKLTEIQTNYPIEKQVVGKWTTHTAGGNPSEITYLNNPQYRLSITPPSCTSPTDKLRIQLMLKGPKKYAMHVKLVRGNGRRITSVLAKDILIQSIGYRYGFCYCEMEDIRPGDYTIVISTLEPGLVGDYVLTVASNVKFNLNSIPLEGAGLFRRDIHGEWIMGVNAMGCVNNTDYNKNPCYHIKVMEMSTIKIRLQAPDIKPSPMLSVKIYEKHPTKPLGNEVGDSGPYANYPQGVCTGDVTLPHNNEGRMFNCIVNGV